jgi:hypothetical protein
MLSLTCARIWPQHALKFQVFAIASQMHMLNVIGSPRYSRQH